MLSRSRLQLQPRLRANRSITQPRELQAESEYRRRGYLSPQPVGEYMNGRYKLVPLQREEESPARVRYLSRIEDRDRTPFTPSPKSPYYPVSNSRIRGYPADRNVQIYRLKRDDQPRSSQDYQLKKYDRVLDRMNRKYDYVPIWESPQISLYQSGQKKKLYKIKSRKKKTLEYQYLDDGERLPVIDRIRIGNGRTGYAREYGYAQEERGGHRYARTLRTFRNFRKVAHAVLFTIYLRTYNERMRQNRKMYFNKLIKEEIADKLLELKRYMVQGSKPFFHMIIDNYNFDYRPLQKDAVSLQREKINSLRKLAHLQIECLHKSIQTMANREYLSEIIYHLCKHGNYSCLYELNTAEQLDLFCISEQHGYIRADKYLEQSAILSLVFIKILLYNILLQPENIDMQISYNYDRTIIFSNMKLVGNILYEVIIDIQDNLLEKAPRVYTVGNWTKLRNRFGFRVAESMTVKQGQFQKNQLISGLADHKYVKDVYGTKSMMGAKNLVEDMVKRIHENMISYHQKRRKRTFTQ